MKKARRALGKKENELTGEGEGGREGPGGKKGEKG